MSAVPQSLGFTESWIAFQATGGMPPARPPVDRWERWGEGSDPPPRKPEPGPQPPLELPGESSHTRWLISAALALVGVLSVVGALNQALGPAALPRPELSSLLAE